MEPQNVYSAPDVLVLPPESIAHQNTTNKLVGIDDNSREMQLATRRTLLIV